MSGEIELIQSRELMNPITGELIALDGPSESLGGLLSDIREMESRAREAKSLVSDELLRRMDKSREWTVHCPGFKLVGQSDAEKPEYDKAGLFKELEKLADEGLIDTDAALRAVEPVLELKVHDSGMKRLLKSPVIAARLEPYITMVPPLGRRVSVRLP